MRKTATRDQFVRATLKGLALGSVALAALTAAEPAWAQEDPLTTLGEDANQPDEDVADQEAADEEVVVTGSRLRRMLEDAPIPVTTLGEAEIELSGATYIADIVNEIPALGLGSDRNNTVRGGDTSAIGTSLLNLRNLGTSRTLVLVDGRRHVGGIPGTTAVDVNTIPTALVERVEVSTGGASVSYGADAVSGAVNFILKDDFEGLQIDGRLGISDEGDSADRYASVTAGTNFGGGRGNIAANFTYNDTDGIRGADRAFVRRQTGFGVNPANRTADDGIPALILFDNTRINITNTTGILRGVNNARQLTFNENGTVRLFDPGTSIGGSSSVGGDGFDLTTVTTIQTPVERLLLDARAHYDLSDAVRVFVEGKYARTEGTNADQPTGDFFTFLDFDPTATPVQRAGDPFFIRRDNPFLPNDPLITQLYAQNPNGVLFSRFSNDLGLRTTTISRDLYRVVGGLEGEIPGLGWDYELYYQYGETDTEVETINTRNSGRFREAVDAVRDPATGQIVCRSVTARANGCQPLNLFGLNRASQGAIDYVRADVTSRGTLSQHVVSGNVTGELFTLIDAPVTFAAGAEYRKESSATIPDPQQIAGTVFDGVVLPVSGSFDVVEGYVELAVPLLRDRPFAEELSIEGGVRVSEYSTAGNTTSWRVGGQYAPVEDIRLRGTYARAVRAPNIVELFSPTQIGFQAIADPCDAIRIGLGTNPAQRQANCATLVPAGFRDPNASVTKRIVNAGNDDLEVETADTLTAGVVIAPRFLPGLRITADYYDIDLTDAITFPVVASIVNDCVDLFASTDNPFCGLVSRDPATGVITEVRRQRINIAGFQARGVDFEANYRTNLAPLLGADAGSLGLRLVGTRLIRLNEQPSPDPARLDRDAGEVGAPKWQANLQAVYDNGPFAFSWLARYIGEQELNVQDVDPENNLPFRFGAETYHDIQARFRFAERSSFFVGVDNLFDNLPERGQGFLANYDVVGRFFYAGASLRF